MASDVVCYRDAYLREVEARVAGLTPGDPGSGTAHVMLDRTVFYPGGGGQPADTGWLRAADGRAWRVRSTRRSGADVSHEVEIEEVAGGEDFAAGAGGEDVSAGLPSLDEAVRASLDWERRYLLMRTHTALHALCGVVWRDHGAQVTGGNMEPGRGRMDFEFESLTGELVGSIEARVNEELARGRPIHVRVLPREEAFAIPDLIRTKVNLLPEGISEIRIVEIEGLDLQADGGLHVADTREVGRVHVTGHESKGRINKRIRIELEDAAPA